MRAIILAAGRGRRMGELTGACPKCLVPVAGKALLDWQTEALSEAGIDEIGVVRGYLGNQLDSRPVRFFENTRWDRTSMLASLLCAGEWLESGPCLVSYADILYSSSIVRSLIHAPGRVVITYDTDWLRLWQARFKDPLEDAETFRCDETGILEEIGGRARRLDEIQGQYMGLLRFTPEGWKQIRDLILPWDPAEIDRMDVTSLLSRAVKTGLIVRTVAVCGGWFEIDSREDLLLCEKWISHNEYAR